MRYRLGALIPRPGSSDYDALHLDPRFAPLLTRALGEVLHLPLSPAPPRESGPTASETELAPGQEVPCLTDFRSVVDAFGA